MNESGINLDFDFDLDLNFDVFLNDAAARTLPAGPSSGDGEQASSFYELKSKTVDPSELGT